MQHKVLRKASVERRPALASTSQRRVTTSVRSPVSILQQRLGNRGAQDLIARSTTIPKRNDPAELETEETARNVTGKVESPVQRSAAKGMLQAASAVSGIASTRSPAVAQLSLSQPGDSYEREAESVADTVMRMAEPTVSRLSSTSTDVSGSVVQRREEQGKETSSAAPQVSPAVSADIRAMQGRGSPLPAVTRSFFERRFTADFSNVRVHTDAHAARIASSINAKAFTVGKNIAFAPGQYAPHSGEGQRLLAHELTHVVQQGGTREGTSGGTIMRVGFPGFGLPAGSPGPKYPAPPKQQPSEAAVRAAAEEVVELQGHTTFDPSPALAEMIDYLSPQASLAVRVRFGKLAYGRIDIKRSGGSFMSTEDPAMIDLTHPAFPGGGYLAPPRLLLSVVNSVVTGHVQFFPWDRIPWTLAGAWLSAFPLQKLLGWKGLDRIRPALAVNAVGGGVLRYRLENFTYRLDGEWEGLGNFDVTDENVQFAADTNVKVPGVADSKMPLQWIAGKVFGPEVNLSLALAPKDILGGKFSGSLEGSFVNGVTNITGEASYTSEKVNGSVTIRVAPIQEAWAQLATHQLPGGGKFTATAGGPGTTHAVFGWGVLDFHFNEWLSGRASVIVDPEGFITTYGYIRPTKEWSFLEGDEYGLRKLLGKQSASAFYPVWLTTGLTGTIAGELWAAGRIGPLTIHDLELAGVYSTNPTVPFNLSLSGVIDVSAIGRLELILSGSLSYTLVGKHLKTVTITVDVTGTGTLKAYSLLKPVFSIEKAKDGDLQFRMKATLKVAAGLYLGLQGSIKASIFGVGPKFKSKKYQWFIKGVGVKSELDYLLGDPKGPEFSIDPYDFDPTEFHNKAENLLDDAAEKYDKKKQETEVRQDEPGVKRALPAAKVAPKVVSFFMNGARHELWIEPDPVPTLFMATRGQPLKKKLSAAETQLKKQEDAAVAAQKALIRAEETAVAALMKRAVDVESSAQSLEERQADVAGLQELARQIELYSKQFTKVDIGDRTADMDSDEKSLLEGEGLVGGYGTLKAAGSRGDDVTPHHMPQDKYMEYKLTGNPGGEKWSYSEGICINMYHPTKAPKKGRHFFTRSYGSFGSPPRYKETPMEALQKDIANVRAIYEKDGLLNNHIKNGLALLHALNVKNYPKLFRGT